jgi:hypothetical protein
MESVIQLPVVLSPVNLVASVLTTKRLKRNATRCIIPGVLRTVTQDSTLAQWLEIVKNVLGAVLILVPLNMKINAK